MSVVRHSYLPGVRHEFDTYVGGRVEWVLDVHPLCFIALSAIGPLATLPFRRYRRAAKSTLAISYWLLLVLTLNPFLWGMWVEDFAPMALVGPLVQFGALGALVVLLWPVLQEKIAGRKGVAKRE